MPNPTPSDGPHGAAQLLAPDLEARVAALERHTALTSWLSPNLRTALISAVVTAAIAIITAGGAWVVAAIRAHTPTASVGADDTDAIEAALPDEAAPDLGTSAP
jgi:hypothetical protein